MKIEQTAKQAKEHVIVVAGCMDRRLQNVFGLVKDQTMSLREKLEKAKDYFKDTTSASYKNIKKLIRDTYGHTVELLTNAGMNIYGMKHGLEQIEKTKTIDGIYMVGHYSSANSWDLGCGGKKKVAKMIVAMANGERVSRENYDHFNIEMYLLGLKELGVTKEMFRNLGKVKVKRRVNGRGKVYLKDTSIGDANRVELVGAVHDRIQLLGAERYTNNAAFYLVNTESMKASAYAEQYLVRGHPKDIPPDLNIARGMAKEHKMPMKELVRVEKLGMDRQTRAQKARVR